VLKASYRHASDKNTLTKIGQQRHAQNCKLAAKHTNKGKQ
jgi:hypothetical protein